MESLGLRSKAAVSRRMKSASWVQPVTAAVHAAAISGAKRRIAASHTEAFIMKMPLFQK